MATLLTVADVLELVETDLPDSVLQRYLDTAEEDVRDYVTSDERKTLPVEVWTGSYSPTLGDADGSLTLPAAINGYPVVRFEGTVAHDGATPKYTVDTKELEEDESGSDTLTPVTANDGEVTAGAFEVSIDSTGKILTVDTTDTTAAITITRVMGLQQSTHPVKFVQAVLDLVQLAVIRRGVESERVGQYSISPADYHKERGKVLTRLVFASGESLAS